MKFLTMATIALLFSAAPARAQIAPSTTKPKAPAPAAPPVATKPTPTPTPTQSPAAATPPAAPADKIDPAKEAAIRHLMDITDTSKLGGSVSSYFETRVRSIMSEALGPDRTTKFMETFSKKLESNVPPSAVVDAMVPIYARAFSMEEIQGLIQFYESPLGQRIVKVMPKVEEDSQNAGLQLGNTATLATLQGMTGDYPELKQMLQDPSAAPEATPTPGSGSAPAQTPPPGPKSNSTPRQ